MFEDDQAILEAVHLPPDASIAKAIGGHHSIESAVADLVDNSIDAGATDIRIRFVESSVGLHAVRVIDNGKGMDREGLLDAMTIGRRSTSTDTARLGHFGMGLKAASLSQAERFTVWTRKAGSEIVAMRLRRDQYSESGEVEFVKVRREDVGSDLPDGTAGTIVQWTDLRSVSRSPETKARKAWINQTIDGVCQSLALTFHRIITEDGLNLVFDLFDSDLGIAGAERAIEPLDPFEFRVSGAPGFPVTLLARSVSTSNVKIEAHILPPKTESSSARLLGKARSESQGFFVYRHRRLLQAGGWNNIRNNRADLQLARVRLDVTDKLSHLVRINAEKRGVEFMPEFAVAVEAAVSEGGDLSFAQYLSTAQEIFKRSQARRRELAPIAPLGRGFHPRVRRQLGRTFPIDPSREPVNIRWKRLSSDAFFEIDLASSTIQLNERYRKRLTGHERGNMNDAPILKTSLFLMLQQYMSKNWLQSTTVEQLHAWQESLNLAADVELDIWEDGD
jgi:hypothetical protein